MKHYNPSPLEAAFNVIVIMAVLIGAALFFTYHPTSWSPMGSYTAPAEPKPKIELPEGWEITPTQPSTERSA